MKKYKNLKIILALVIIFFIVIVLINPRGNFPLNDDWVYGHTVSELLFNHHLDFYEWTGPILIAQTFYGFLITKFTGFSFTWLRLSTLALGFLILIIFYFLCLKTNKHKLLIILTALTLLVNPLFLNTSFTFLTDIPFLFFYLLAIYFFLRAFDKEKNIFLILAFLSAIISFFIRQNGILFFIASLLFYFDLLKNKNLLKTKSKKNLLLFLGSILICLTGYLLFKNYINISGGQTHLIEQNLGLHILKWFFFTIQYLGLFCLPISILYLFNKNFYQKKNITFFLIFFLILLIISFQFNLFFPYNQNIINDYGLGPNIKILQGLPLLIFNLNLKIILSIIACFAGAILLIVLKIKWLAIKNNSLLTFIAYNFLLQLLIILSFLGFDRYFLLLLPLILILILPDFKINKFIFVIPILLLSILAFFSVSLTKNYLDWNRARNILYQQISQTKFYYQIEGGYELNGWYTYNIMQNFPVVVDLTKPWYLHRLFSANTNEYIISFSVLSKHKILAFEEYYNYFLFKKVKIYLLQKMY
ncbi:glycosyltransferase family 39 protein [Patescibacteria group bacterium]|nr:glycosyltransferase family 39 protein [Patescibacteria group bacterium]